MFVSVSESVSVVIYSRHILVLHAEHHKDIEKRAVVRVPL